jgi:hypothetical protein
MGVKSHFGPSVSVNSRAVRCCRSSARSGSAARGSAGGGPGKFPRLLGGWDGFEFRGGRRDGLVEGFLARHGQTPGRGRAAPGCGGVCGHGQRE